MAREYDIFYDAAGEGAWAEFREFGLTTNGAQTVESYPKSYATYGVTFANSQDLAAGTVVVIRDSATTSGVNVTAYMEVVEDYVEAATTIILRPLCSKGDTLAPTMNSIVGHTFASLSVIATRDTRYLDVGESAWAEASRLVIDLTEAPDETYDYVVFGAGWMNATINNPAAATAITGGTQTEVRARLRICQPDDIYADAGINTDDDVYTENVVTITKASTKQADLSTNWTDYAYELDGGQCYNAQVGGILSLAGGQRYDLSLQFCCEGNAPNTSTYTGHKIEVVQMHQARMVAFRYDASASTTFRATATTGTVGGSTSTGQVANGHEEVKLTNGTSTATEYLGNATNPTSANALTVSVVLAGSDDITSDSGNSVLLNNFVDGSASRGETLITPMATGDLLAQGIVRFDEFDSNPTGNDTKIEMENPDAGGNTHISYGFLITFVPSILSSGTAASIDGPSRIDESISSAGWQDLDFGDSSSFGGSGAGAVASRVRSVGYTTQILCTGITTSLDAGTADVAWIRPRGVSWDGSSETQVNAPFGRMGYLGNGTGGLGDKCLITSFFDRAYNSTAATDRIVSAQALLGDGSGGGPSSTESVGCNNPQTTAFYEIPVAEIPLDAATTVIAELLPGIGLKAWELTDSTPGGSSSVGTTYKTTLSSKPEIKEVYRGLTKLTESSVASPGDSDSLGGTDYWHYDSSTGVLRIQLDTAYVPTKSSSYIYAVTPIRVALRTENISHADTYYPYESRMSSLPGFSKTLSSSNGRFQNSVSLGKISLASADGEYDNEFFDYIWQGRDANLWIGNSTVSDKIEDFTLIARASMVIPSWSTSKIDIGLMDRKVDLSKQLHNSTVDWISGKLTETTTLKQQPIPVVYGEVKRIPAYRTGTNGDLAGSGGTYTFAANNCNVIRNVYGTADSTRSIAGTSLSQDNSSEGNFVITNTVAAGLVSPVGDYTFDVDDVPDTLYVDVLGQCDRDGGGSVTKSYFHLGEIAYDILTRTAPGESHAPVAATNVDKTSFDLVDLRKRHTFSSVDDASDADNQGFRETQVPVQIGVLIPSGQTVAQTLNEICNGTFCYWKTNAAGRIAIDVADFYGGNLIVNGSAELPGSSVSSTAIYPWRTLGAGNSIERKRINVANDNTRVPAFNGQYAIKLTSTEPIDEGYAYQDVAFPKAGTYVLTFVGSTIDADFFGQLDALLTVRVFLADGSYIDLGTKALPNPRKATYEIGDAAWARYAEDFEIEFGNAGIGQVAFNCDWEFLGVSINSIVALDMVQLFPVACVLTDENTIVGNMNFNTENYYGYGVPFDARQAVKELGRKQSRVRTFVDSEAVNGTFASTEFSEAKDLIESSGVVTLNDPILVDEADADGVAAAGVTYYSRQRVTLEVKVLGLTEIPVIGEYVYMKSVSRVDSGPDEHPIWRIMSVKFDAKMPKTVSLKLEKPVDPVSDRMATAYLD